MSCCRPIEMEVELNSDGYVNLAAKREGEGLLMNILGISAFYHDSAACLVQDEVIVAAAQEERFTRKKHDADFPKQAARYCLEEGGIQGADVNLVSFYEKPFLKFERLLETYLTYAPVGLRSFLKAMPVWIKFPHSLGLLYSAFTAYLGFKVNSGEYKVMGLAPYGEPKFKNLILSERFKAFSEN